MDRTLALACVFLLPTFVHADMAVLPQRRGLPVQVTITIDRDSPDYEFFVVDNEKNSVERVSLTTAQPLILKSEDRDGFLFGLSIHAVPKADLVAQNGGETRHKEWLERHENRKYFAGSLYERGRVNFTDNRDRIEKSFVLRILPDSCRLELVSENHGNRGVEGGWVGLCCVLPMIAIVWFGCRIVRTLNRDRSP
jgi:hypothetical protein